MTYWRYPSRDCWKASGYLNVLITCVNCEETKRQTVSYEEVDAQEMEPVGDAMRAAGWEMTDHAMFCSGKCSEEYFEVKS